MIRPSSDLPEPDGPMMPRHSPGARLNETPFSKKLPEHGTATPTLLTVRLPCGLSSKMSWVRATGVMAGKAPLSRR